MYGTTSGQGVGAIYDGAVFSFNPNAPPPCFNKGTKILCLVNGKETCVPVEEATSNTLVKTYNHGYRKPHKIHTGKFINNPNNPTKCMYKMSAQKYNITEDLIMTGGHSMLVDKVTRAQMNKQGNISSIDGKYLVQARFCDCFEKVTNNQTFTWYHIEFEPTISLQKQYGIYANGILTESTFNKI